METWMVDLLFGQPGQATTDTGTAETTAPPTVSVTSVARSTVAAGTGQAISALQAGGAGAAPDTGTSGPKYLTVAQANAMVASNNALTSAQISKALYGGGGLQSIDSVGQTDTFADIIQRERDAAQISLSLADDPAAAAAAGQDPASLREDAARTNAYADSMQKAFDNHTLVIQRLSDIPSLKYTLRAELGGSGPNSLPDSATWTGGYDQEAMKEFIGKFKNSQHVGTPSIGGVDIVITWTDAALQFP
jgi:hypothetical protein